MRNLLLTCLAAAALGSPAASAALNIPSDGSDGDLVITANTEIDLSQAPTGNWDANNNANAGKGIYDPAKWAVVFKYSSVTVNAGATVTFKNHASRAPVVWLVQSNVTIAGTISLDGQSSREVPYLSEPGPGGFRGGMGAYGPQAGNGPGFGIGGGSIDVPNDGVAGVGGIYGSSAPGWGRGSPYGNPSIVPLVGGSGGGGVAIDERNRHIPPVSGGAGGGAILIACSREIHLAGFIRAKGGNGGHTYSTTYRFGGGSGGAVRLVAETLSGAGGIRTPGGNGTDDNAAGGLGRIRIERVHNESTVSAVPDPSVVELPAASVPSIWMPEAGPAVRIVSVGGGLVPQDPRAEFGAVGADVKLPRVSTTEVVIETTNVETASQVFVRVTPRTERNFTRTAAVLQRVVSEDPLVVLWFANVPVNDGYSAMQVHVIRP